MRIISFAETVAGAQPSPPGLAPDEPARKHAHTARHFHFSHKDMEPGIHPKGYRLLDDAGRALAWITGLCNGRSESINIGAQGLGVGDTLTDPGECLDFDFGAMAVTELVLCVERRFVEGGLRLPRPWGECWVRSTTTGEWEKNTLAYEETPEAKGTLRILVGRAFDRLRFACEGGRFTITGGRVTCARPGDARPCPLGSEPREQGNGGNGSGNGA